MNRRFHLYFPISGGNHGVSLTPMVTDSPYFLFWLSTLVLVGFGVIVFPLLGWYFPVIDLRFSGGVRPSNPGFDDVFPVVEIWSSYLQPFDVCLLASQFNGMRRALKQPWPPPDFIFLSERYGNLSSCTGWCGMIIMFYMVVVMCDWFQPFAQIFRKVILIINGWVIVSSVPPCKGLLQGSENFKAIKRQKMLFRQYNKLKIWRYGFQNKRIQMSRTYTTKYVISCSGSVWDGLRCNRWIASKDLFDKRCLLRKIESHKKDFKRPRTKWRKASESACPTNALGSIVLLLSLLKVLFNNISVVIYVSCNLLH